MLLLAGTCAVVGGVALLILGVLIRAPWVTYLGWVAIATGGVWFLCARYAETDPMRAPERRYLREFFPAMAAYVITVMTIWPLVTHVHSPIGKALIALLPVLPVIFVVRAMLRFILASDELQQRMQLEAISIASLTVGLLSFAAAFLQNAGIFQLRSGLMWVLPALFAVYGIAMLWIRRRYRDD